MPAKFIALIVSALLVQSLSGRCLNNRLFADDGYFGNNFGWASAGIPGNGLSLGEEAALGAGYGRFGLGGYYGSNYGWENGASGFPGNGLSLAEEAAIGGGYNSAAALNGGGPFGVSSSSPIAPNGISAVADNLLYEGPVAVQGAMPFLGTAEFGGELPAGGMATIAYGAGDDRVGITGQRGGSGANAAAATAAANGGAGYGAGLASRFGYGAGLAGAGFAGAGSGLAGTALTNGLGYGSGLGWASSGLTGSDLTGPWRYGAGFNYGLGNGYGLGSGAGGCACGL